MKDHNEGSAALPISDQAAEWFVRLKDGDMTTADRRKFVRWLKHSPAHIAEFIRLCNVYTGVKRAKLPTYIPAEEEPSNVIELTPRQAPPAAEPADQRPVGPMRLGFAGAAGGFALVSLIGLIAKLVFFNHTIETGEAELRQFELSDGSIVRAGPRTHLQYDFDDERRYIHLERGEAVFEVARDSARPFLVDAEPLVVRAVGTKFGVVRHEDKVTVTVAEGKVAVSRQLPQEAQRAQPHIAPVPLTADEQVSVPRTAQLAPLAVQKVNATRELAWARGRLVFDSETLAEAVREFNRLNRTQIIVDDPTIASYQVCCVFDASDPETFAKSIAADPSIDLVRDESGVLRLVPEADYGEEPAEETSSGDDEAI